PAHGFSGSAAHGSAAPRRGSVRAGPRYASCPSNVCRHNGFEGARHMTKRIGFFRHTVALGLVAGTATLAACGTISTQQEQQLGADYAAQINRQLPIVNDAQVNAYINDLGREIAAAGDRRLPYRFYIVNA